MRTGVSRRLALPTIGMLGLLALPPAAFAQGRGEAAPHVERLVAAAVAQTHSKVTYDGSYRGLPIPVGTCPKRLASAPMSSFEPTGPLAWTCRSRCTRT